MWGGGGGWRIVGLVVARLHMLEPQMLGLSTVGRRVRHGSLVTSLWLLQQVLLLNELVKQKWLGRLVVLVLFLERAGWWFPLASKRFCCLKCNHSKCFTNT